jgi:hypothetical protein
MQQVYSHGENYVIKKLPLMTHDFRFSINWCSEEAVVLPVLAKLDVKVCRNSVLS